MLCEFVIDIDQMQQPRNRDNQAETNRQISNVSHELITRATEMTGIVALAVTNFNFEY